MLWDLFLFSIGATSVTIALILISVGGVAAVNNNVFFGSTAVTLGMTIVMLAAYLWFGGGEEWRETM